MYDIMSFLPTYIVDNPKKKIAKSNRIKVFQAFVEICMPKSSVIRLCGTENGNVYCLKVTDDLMLQLPSSSTRQVSCANVGV